MDEALLRDPDPSGEWTIESTARVELAVDVESIVVVGLHRGDQTVATGQRVHLPQCGRPARE